MITLFSLVAAYLLEVICPYGYFAFICLPQSTVVEEGEAVEVETKSSWQADPQESGRVRVLLVNLYSIVKQTKEPHTEESLPQYFLSGVCEERGRRERQQS